MLDFSGMRNQNAQAKVFKTQKQMAELIGIKESRFSSLMKGKINPSLREIDKLCILWDCEIQDIVKIRRD